MAIDAFLKIKGIEGESVKKGFEKQIEVLAWSWGVSQTGSMHSGSGAGTGRANVQDISFTHYVDTASPNFLLNCCTGKHFDDAELTMRKAGGDSAVDYVKIKLTGVMVSSVSIGGSGGEERLTENVSLNFAKWEFAYTPQTEKGAKSSEIKTTFDVAKNSK